MNMQKEPALIIAGIVALIGAFLAMLGTFGVAVNQEQQDSIKGFVTVAAPIAIALVGWIIRSKVVSPASAGVAVGKAKQQEPGSNVVPEINVAGFKEAAAKELGRSEASINWRPPVDKT